MVVTSPHDLRAAAMYNAGEIRSDAPRVMLPILDKGRMRINHACCW